MVAGGEAVPVLVGGTATGTAFGNQHGVVRNTVFRGIRDRVLAAREVAAEAGSARLYGFADRLETLADRLGEREIKEERDALRSLARELARYVGGRHDDADQKRRLLSDLAADLHQAASA